MKIGPHTNSAQQHHEVGDQRAVTQRPRAQVKSRHVQRDLQRGFGRAVDGLHCHADTQAMHTRADQAVIDR